MAVIIEVTSNPQKKTAESNASGSGTPDHWANAKGSAFHNPWSSWRTTSLGERISLFSQLLTFPTPPKDPSSVIPIRQPTWGLGGPLISQSKDGAEETKDKIKSTWLGHACFLVEFPARYGQPRGARILFDPVFSDRCSPSQWVGPKRFTPPPCKIEDIPDVDAIVISHNHYDHLDTHTIRTLFKRPSTPHVFAPLGNAHFFQSLSVSESHTHIMDWWESKRISVSFNPSNKDGNTNDAEESIVTVDLTCTPCQHFTGRTPFDTFKTLWASWAVEEVLPPSSTQESSRPPVKAYFAGDTGYRAVMDHQDETTVPVCPVFKEIGDRFGGFDFAMIPIGAYLPRSFMSPIHCAPQDSVLLFKDIRAKKAVGMHWATWILTTEDVKEPPKRLAEECKKAGIEDGAFTICDIGETLFF